MSSNALASMWNSSYLAANEVGETHISKIIKPAALAIK
jgi:hypothetical protein